MLLTSIVGGDCLRVHCSNFLNKRFLGYLPLDKEAKGTGAGLMAAAILAIVPSYISRSVAGSYDNEAVAIFALVFTFYLYVKTLNTGSLFYATLNALSYFYMVILGTLLAALVPVVGFNAVLTSEHFASFLVFIILHVVAFVYYIKGLLTPRLFKMAMTLVITVVALVASSPTKAGRRGLSLLDPTYASKYIPIIASVSEHQPPTWPSYFMDINVLAFLVPAGIISCFLPLSDASSFMVLYLVTAVYFSGVMVRLMLVLAPAACILSGIALSSAFDVLTSGNGSPNGSSASTVNTSSSKNEKTEKSEAAPKEKPSKKNRKKDKEVTESVSVKPKKEKRLSVLPLEASIMGTLLLVALGGFYVVHCVWAAAEAYSAPSIVLTSRSHDKVASWWDYGYQTTAMANRTVIVNNNTWNNTHIATVGTAMSSPEKAAWEIFDSLDVKYVLVVFGVRGYEIGKKHFKLTHFEENRIRGKLKKLKSSAKTSSALAMGGRRTHGNEEKQCSIYMRLDIVAQLHQAQRTRILQN
ncbi:hypothetical protein ZWY2020_014964 [Hordeum vulgare]|nr:hypothetical protein ZWY2020_014964 [Hordeum vulgare]